MSLQLPGGPEESREIATSQPTTTHTDSRNIGLSNQDQRVDGVGRSALAIKVEEAGETAGSFQLLWTEVIEENDGGHRVTSGSGSTSSVAATTDALVTTALSTIGAGGDSADATGSGHASLSVTRRDVPNAVAGTKTQVAAADVDDTAAARTAGVVANEVSAFDLPDLSTALNTQVLSYNQEDGVNVYSYAEADVGSAGSIPDEPGSGVLARQSGVVLGTNETPIADFLLGGSRVNGEETQTTGEAADAGAPVTAGETAAVITGDATSGAAVINRLVTNANQNESSQSVLSKMFAQCQQQWPGCEVEIVSTLDNANGANSLGTFTANEGHDYFKIGVSYEVRVTRPGINGAQAKEEFTSQPLKREIFTSVRANTANAAIAVLVANEFKKTVAELAQGGHGVAGRFDSQLTPQVRNDLLAQRSFRFNFNYDEHNKPVALSTVHANIPGKQNFKLTVPQQENDGVVWYRDGRNQLQKMDIANHQPLILGRPVYGSEVEALLSTPAAIIFTARFDQDKSLADYKREVQTIKSEIDKNVKKTDEVKTEIERLRALPRLNIEQMRQATRNYAEFQRLLQERQNHLGQLAAIQQAADSFASKHFNDDDDDSGSDKVKLARDVSTLITTSIDGVQTRLGSDQEYISGFNDKLIPGADNTRSLGSRLADDAAEVDELNEL